VLNLVVSADSEIDEEHFEGADMVLVAEACDQLIAYLQQKHKGNGETNHQERVDLDSIGFWCSLRTGTTSDSAGKSICWLCRTRGRICV